MRLRAGTKKVTIEYGDETLGIYSTIDVMQEYLKHGGTISPNTEIEFQQHFPGSGYKKTALSECMPDTYLCKGSMSLMVYENSLYQGAIAVSVYEDTSVHNAELGDHSNLFLQWDVLGTKSHTNNIPNRHIPINNKVKIKGLIDGKEAETITI